jgi:hypothetical protein
MSTWVRQFHRWLSIAFTLGVIAYMVAMSRGTPPNWLGLFALVPLILLLMSGLCLFALPYLLKARRARAAG